jgi:hypothetical protein
MNARENVTMEILVNRAIESRVSAALFYEKELGITKSAALEMAKKGSCLGPKPWAIIVERVNKGD